MSGKKKLSPWVVCPHCGEGYAPEEVSGAWLGRVCPRCGRPLTSVEFDKRAGAISDELERLSQFRHEQNDMATRHAKIARLVTNPRLELVRRVLRWNSERHRSAADKSRARTTELSRKSDELARSRYYASEWYLCSGVPLEDGEGPDDRYRLTPSYGRGGLLALRCGTGTAGWGARGEWVVFERLLGEVQPGGLLDGARLVPNLFVPSVKDASIGLSDQVDLIILMRWAAVVCEVKSWRSHVSVEAHAGGLRIGTYRDRGRTQPDSRDTEKPLRQVARGVEDFAALGTYPANRVLGLVVFVDPRSFQVEGVELGGTMVASCDTDGGGTILEVLGNMLGRVDSVVSQGDLDTLADKMLCSWVDRDGALTRERQERWKAHKESERREGLTALADASVKRREDVFLRQRSNSKIRTGDAGAYRKKKSKKEGARRRQRVTRRRMDELLEEWEEWAMEESAA